MSTKDLRGNDVIDSRAVIDRIEELEAELADVSEQERDQDAVEELAALRGLEEEACGSPDWRYGGTLIREDYFQEYAQQLAEDIGAISGQERWPLTCIDWEQAARELQVDYSAVTFGEHTYYIRS